LPKPENLFLMSWSYRIARVSGIDVKIHVTFFLLVAWFGAIYYQQGGPSAAFAGIGFILLLFLCVLLHEFGHAFAARMYGIRTPDITLLPFGGVARLERMPEKPYQELVVAIAGPAVNIAIAAGLYVFLASPWHPFDFGRLEDASGNLLAKLMAVNVMLVVFNAIPAFPMDGGRVLRALLAMRGDYLWATTIAARVGQGIAVLFVVAYFMGWFGSPMILFIAMFVFSGAQQELAYARFRGQVATQRVGDLALAEFVSIPADATLKHARDLARDNGQTVFPLLDENLRSVGCVTRADLLAQGADETMAVRPLARPVNRISASALISSLMQSFPPGEVVVVENPAGQVIGLVQNPGHSAA